MRLKAFSGILQKGLRQLIVVRILNFLKVLGKKFYQVLCQTEKIKKIYKYARKLQETPGHGCFYFLNF